MTKTVWPRCSSYRFEHPYIGILNLFGAWSLGFGIYSLRMKFTPFEKLPAANAYR